jgi:hypothetical protein
MRYKPGDGENGSRSNFCCDHMLSAARHLADVNVGQFSPEGQDNESCRLIGFNAYQCKRKEGWDVTGFGRRKNSSFDRLRFTLKDKE